MRATALATVRFETPPGKQLQDDVGETYARIAGERAKVHRHERQVNWLLAMEAACRNWRRVPAEVLFQNARALVKEHDQARLVLVFNGWEVASWEALEAHLGWVSFTGLPGPDIVNPGREEQGSALA